MSSRRVFADMTRAQDYFDLMHDKHGLVMYVEGFKPWNYVIDTYDATMILVAQGKHKILKFGPGINFKKQDAYEELYRKSNYSMRNYGDDPYGM